MAAGWFSTHRTLVLDVTIGVALAVAGVLNMVFIANEMPLPNDTRAPNGYAYALVLVQTLPVIWRRSAPVVLLGLTAAGFVVARLFDFPVGVEIVGVSIAMFAVGMGIERSRAPRIAWPFIAGLTGFTALGALTEPEVGLGTVGLMFATLLLPYLLGRDAYERRARSEAAERRASELEQNQRTMEEAAVRDERTRIARELHDVVAHQMTVMTIQAAAARRMLDHDPSKAAKALAAVETAGHEALVEMRRMLGVLRTDTADGAAHPQPGLTELDDLVSQMDTAGLPVALAVHGIPRTLPPGVDLNAYRIIQEALTNTLKHGGASVTARVTVTYGDETLRIEVTDTGRGAASSMNGEPAGQGIVGMKERVAILAGSLRAGPHPGGGFVVSAELPIPASTAAVS